MTAHPTLGLYHRNLNLCDNYVDIYSRSGMLDVSMLDQSVSLQMHNRIVGSGRQ